MSLGTRGKGWAILIFVAVAVVSGLMNPLSLLVLFDLQPSTV